MDRVVQVTIKGRLYTLNYSVAVMFDMADKYGDIQKALDALAQSDREGFDTLQWFLLKLSEDGELTRREEGYDPAPFLKAADISPRMKPLEYEELKGAVVDAITMGYHREVEADSEEIDVGLQELNEKKEKAGA